MISDTAGRLTFLDFFSRTEDILDYFAISFDVGNLSKMNLSVLSWNGTGIDLTYDGSTKSGRISRRDMDIWYITGLRRRIDRATGKPSTILEVQ